MPETDLNQRAMASRRELAALTAEIVGAYVAHHQVATTDLPGLIASVGSELVTLGKAPAEPNDEKPKPAVPVKRSIRPDELVCLICGKPTKILKRHLGTQHDLTPDAYRKMFGLLDDYPLVAPAYAATRSALAKKIGLGRRPQSPKPDKTPRKRAVKKGTTRKSQARGG